MSFLQARLDLGRAGSSADITDDTRAVDLCRKSQTKSSERGATQHPNFGIRPRISYPSENIRRKEESFNARFHVDALVWKEAQVTQSNTATPFTTGPDSARALRKAKSYERTLGVLSSSEARSRIPRQGQGTASFPSVKDRSAQYLSRAAVAAAHVESLPDQAGATEKCALCSKSVYSAERMVIQNVPLHRACFCCKSCGRKLSLFNYATFRGAFYCKVHCSLLADATGRIQGENSPVKQNYQIQPPTTPLPSSESETKTRNNKTANILMREKMQPMLSRFPIQTHLRLPNPTRRLATQTKFGLSGPFLKEAAKADAGQTFNTTSKKRLEDTVLILHNQSRYAESTQKKSIAETVFMGKSQLPGLTFPKCGEHVSHWVKIVGRSRDGGLQKKRVSFIDRSSPGIQPRKQGLSVVERTAMFERDVLKSTRFPAVSPLTSVLAEASSLGSLPSSSSRVSKATNFSGSSVAVPDASGLASSEMKEPSKASSGEDYGRSNFQRAAPLLRLPRLAPDDGRKQLPEDGKSDAFITPCFATDQAFQDAEPEGKPGSSAAKIEDDQSITSLQSTCLENINVLPRSCLQGTTTICNTIAPANGNPELDGSSVRGATTNGEVPQKAGNGNNIELVSQRDTFGETVLQASEPQIRESEPLYFCQGPSFINSATENLGAEFPSDEGATVQAVQNKNAIGDSASKSPLKRESNPFASTVPGGTPKQEPARLKKAPKIQSALITLFGNSLDKRKNPNVQPGKKVTDPIVEARSEQFQFVACLMPGASKKEGTSVADTQTGGSEASLQDSENLETQSREGKIGK